VTQDSGERMRSARPAGYEKSRPAARVGLFGLLGSGNWGNEASTETVLAYLRRAHPGVQVDAMSAGVERVRDAYGISAIPLSWQEKQDRWARGPAKAVVRILGKFVDPVRIFRWVRRHDLVIVPGMGVLEDTTPVRAYGFPLTMFLLSAAGRVFRVKVALVSVGTSVIRQRATRWLFVAAARLAYYRSFRDEYSRTAMRQQGLDTRHDDVFPDLVFAFETPPYDPGDQRLVAVGVMDYYGGNDDRDRAEELHASYVAHMTRFTDWLLDNGYRVRFFGGDDSCDYTVADEIITHVQRRFSPGQAADLAAIASFTTYAGMLDEMNRAGTVVATRFHNVLGGLLVGKPTVAIGYSRKFVALMESFGLQEFVELAAELDSERLIAKFKEAQDRRAELVARITKRNGANAEAVASQFASLSASLFPAVGRVG
jgi:polysaccharide pyruvyl transferase WcaK-like protein